MISVTSTGNYQKTVSWLQKVTKSGSHTAQLHKYGQDGVDALSRATPRDTGLTADSWRYRIVGTKDKPGIEWYNTNVHDGSPIAILIQYGHGTGHGGYIRGRDYINPAMRPIFDKIVANFWKEVMS